MEEPQPEPVVEEKNNDIINLDVKNMTVAEAIQLGENRRFNPDIFKKILEEDSLRPGWIKKMYEKSKSIINEQGYQPSKVLTSAIKKCDIDIHVLLKKYDNLSKVIKNEKLGDNWKEIKDEARLEYAELLEYLAAKFTKLYDCKYDIYLFVLFYIMNEHKEFFTLGI